MAYESWASTYESFEGRTSQDTWQLGIVAEVAARAGAEPHVLDLGAGTGVGERELLRRLPNSTVTSLERSAEMLAAGNFIGETVKGDMTAFDLGRTFDVIVCGFDALNYVPPLGLTSVFECARAHLEIGGWFIFDYSSPKVLREDWRHEDYVNETAVGTLTRSHRWYDSTQKSVTLLTFKVGSEVKWQETHTQYSIDTYDLWRILSRQGFSVDNVRNIDSPGFSPACTTHVWILAAV